ncbi:MAG: heme-binding protein [Planctomycetota bacterium]
MPNALPLALLSLVALTAVAASCATRRVEGTDTYERSNFVETLSLVGDSATALVGVRTFEAPDYEVLEKDGPFEVRRYDDLSVVRTSSSAGGDRADGEAFGRLFDYLSGANERDKKVAMTVPVLMEEIDGSTEMTFVLPGRYTADSAPAPDAGEVETATVAVGRVATVRFSGRLTDANVARRTEELRAWIAGRGLTVVGEPLSAGYDPPFTLPFLRRNEVWIRVQ